MRCARGEMAYPKMPEVLVCFFGVTQEKGGEDMRKNGGNLGLRQLHVFVCLFVCLFVWLWLS